jgi:S-(hydroxymethyl)glutathione dehydrogenase/alcohol dehydrogenase
MGRKLIVEEVELADPEPNEARIKVMTCSICHSDIHAMMGEHGEYEGASAVGHEISGIVDAVGKNVTYVKPGDRVLCSLMSQGCGVCDKCLEGRIMWFCRNIDRSAKPNQYTRLNGEPVKLPYGFAGFSTYTNVNERRIVKLDDDISFEVGSALACGFISGFAAVLNRCKIKPGESFAVTGCGGVGLSALMGARVSGAVPIIAIDTQQVKLDAAVKFGATHTVNPKAVDPVKAVLDITDGYGVDHSIVAVAGPGIKRSTFDLTAGDGQMVIVGHGHPNDEGMGEFNFMEFLRGKRITGSVLGAISLRRDVPKCMEMYRRGMVDIDALFTNRFKLDDIQAAIDDSERGALKNIVICNE